MTLDDRLEHYQDENTKNVNKLMASKTPDWVGTYEEEKKNLKQAILSDLEKIIEQSRTESEWHIDGNVAIQKTGFITEQELRQKVKEYTQ